MHRVLITLLIGLLVLPGALAQDAPPQPPPEQTPLPEPEQTPPPAMPIQPETIVLTAEDGLDLVGDFYLLNPDAATVVLLHQIYRTRVDWQPYAELLNASGFNVLAVDLRGWGDTGGDIFWEQAVDDVALWLLWLREVAGVQPDTISLMGSSMGSSLALVGCAQDPLCATAIAVSPGWSYYGISVQEAFSTQLQDRPVLLVYAERDSYPRRGVPQMLTASPNPDLITVQAYPGNAHGMDLMGQEVITFLPLMLDWLTTYGVAPSPAPAQ